MAELVPVTGPDGNLRWERDGSALPLGASVQTNLETAVLGPEKFTNPTVAANSTGWTLAGGVTWSGGFLVFPASGVASQTIAVVAGTQYRIQWNQLSWPHGGNIFTVAVGAATQIALTGGNQAVVITALVTGNVTVSITADPALTGTLSLNNFSMVSVTAPSTPMLTGLSSGVTQLEMRADSLHNTALGLNALSTNGDGSATTAIGYNALAVHVDGNANTAVGSGALQSSQNCEYSTAVGQGALANAQNGYDNVAVGQGALGSVTNGVYASTAVGTLALFSNVSGQGNVALGNNSLTANLSGSFNVALGTGAMQANTVGSNSTAVGQGALAAATTQIANTAVGSGAMAAATITGGNNVAVGAFALASMVTAQSNVALGYSALNAATSSTNTAVGFQSGNKGAGVTGQKTVTGHDNTFLGANTGPGSAGAGASSYMLAIGSGATAIGDGAVAIGVDSAGTAAAAAATNNFVLGTALHQIKISNNTTGAGSAALGANSPAVTPTAPYTWFKMMSSDGSTVYVPAWK